MKIVNADYGIDLVPMREKQKWYQHPRFPLVPMFDYRPGDEWNERDWSFSWLNVRAWTTLAPHISIALELMEQGLDLRISPPYAHIHIWLLMFPDVLGHRLWRKPAKKHEA